MAALRNGDVRSVQPRQLFTQMVLPPAVYRSEMASRAIALGYEVMRDRKTGAPEIVGYTADYLKANSPTERRLSTMVARRKTVRGRGPRRSRRIRPARRRCIHRRRRQTPTPEMAAKFGNQPTAVRVARSTSRCRTSAGLAASHRKRRGDTLPRNATLNAMP